MANEPNDIKLISRNNSGFPDWLDFSKLRAEGIDYIGKLAGKIWTDHNVHDPGITTLEALCYALLDLGYRTNLPAEDIFARDPEDTSPDDNFLTPAEILTINPLTITDFRKLLIDIPGIKNAWLEVATDQHADDICKSSQDQTFFAVNANFDYTNEKDPCCDDYLNGLYHVYVDTEHDLSAPGSDKERKCLIEKIKNALMGHRNICEDFLDVTFLCKWEIGVCANIDLDDTADPEKVYLEMVEKLRQFFSPSPRFYTLAQMLEKNKSMDEIFAGRAFDTKESHGFIDSDELEQLQLRKSIHISDVYNVLFSVEGIRKVKQLRLVNCKGSLKKNLDEWIVKIPGGNVPDFSVECSGFAFNRRGMPLSFDFKKYDALLKINFEQNGKILYSPPSDKLDAKIPRGIFHKDLGIYTSIQNEFPRVYGIAEGGLPDNVPVKRKAQALQFKGYLLFFDQLLANYLSQLQHIRSLFPIRSNPGSNKKGITYFSSMPGGVPDFQQLVRYKADESSDETIGETGYLAFPVSKAHFATILDQQQQRCLNIEDLQHYRFSTAAEKDIAVAQLQDDMLNEICEIYCVTRQDGCVFYYVVSSSEDFVLVSRKYYSDEQSAMVAASSIKYAGTIRSNYRSAIVDANNGYSFTVELNITGYACFLQQLTEDDALYTQRRQLFLNHLLARFAETFTDYALLSYPFYSSDDLQSRDALAKLSYLSNYPLLSSTRGKAFDYSRNGWHTDNNSGYEKRIRALLGHDELKRKTLCNFEVYDYGEKFVFRLKLSSALSITTQEKFDTREEAGKAARELFDALGLHSNYHIESLPYQEGARILIKYGHGREAGFDTVYPSVHEAESAADYFHRMIALPSANGFIEVVDYLHTICLKNNEGSVVRKFNSPYNSEENVRVAAQKAINKINDPQLWATTAQQIGKLLINPAKKETVTLIDESYFKIDVDNNIIGNPNLYIYELLDKGNHFLFRSLMQFAEARKAKEACVHAIRLLANKDNLQVKKIEGEERWTVFITEADNSIAQCSIAVTEEEAPLLKDRIWKVIAPYVYYFDSEAVPNTRKFYYRFGYVSGKEVLLESNQVYYTRPEAELALVDFSNTISRSYLKKSGKDWQILFDSDKEHPVVLGQFPDADDEQMKQVSEWLQTQKEIGRIKEAQQEGKMFASYVDVHEESKCHFVYHLVDKDGVYAIFKDSFADKNAALTGLQQAVTLTSSLLDFLELQMAANISEYLVPETNTKWYHYQLISHNYITKPSGGSSQRLALFESTKGYLSKDEAEQAFTAEYMHVLTFALDKDNYGERKPISEKEIFIRDENGCNRSDTIAYVPAETLSFLGNYPQQAITELIKIVSTFPVRSIKKTQQETEFKKLFERCEPQEDPDCVQKSDDPCYSEEEAPVYYFALFDKQAGQIVWQSVNYYDTVTTAMTAFRFFVFLLKYQPNYTAMPDCGGGYRLYIREVLAESRSRYYTEGDAWGKQGVQKFVAVSQQPCSFHAYTDKDCCFRFFVACNNTRVFHPCKYDSPVVRDRVIKQLQHFLPSILKWKFSFCNRKWDRVLRDFDGTIVARVESQNNWNPTDQFTAYLDLFMLIGTCCYYINEKEGFISMETDQLKVKFYPEIAGQKLEELKERLFWLACYFPFARKVEEDQTIKYCIEIRLPGFNVCEPCSDKHSELCSVAWTSECCFDSCTEVLDAYEKIVAWLTDFRLYKPVFDCPCGSYGIELYDDTIECIGTKRQIDQPVFSLPKIIAVSPQCYYSAEMVCEAIKRAKNLINSEGLHLIEHILLRPHCPEDCQCLVQPCPPSDAEDSLDRCRFPYWTSKNDDPCDTTRPVCFRPGSDPYSFIATVALPAWPERFRNEDNQILLENMLQREIPAHVALRILWLTPHDMCCLETRFRRWLMWTAYKKTRTDTSVACDLVRFLFTREFECLSTDLPCEPCGGTETEPLNCARQLQMEETMFVRTDKCMPMSWEEQLNQLFCWPGYNCTEDFIDCNEYFERKDQITQDPALVQQADEKPEQEIVLSEKRQSKPQFFNGRLAKRKKRLDTIAETSGADELASRTKRFIESSLPSIAAATKLIKDLGAVPQKEKKSVTKQLVPVRNELVMLTVHSFLDKLVANEEFEDFDQLQPLVGLLNKIGYNARQIYLEWQPGKIAEHVDSSRVAAIEKQFTS